MSELPLGHPRRVYCAGPLFNSAERREIVEIADHLAEAGFLPFVPHRDGMEFADVRPYLIERGHDPLEVGQLLHEAVFALDTYQVIVGCGSLVCNLNGRVPDEGAVAETAMAWTVGKPIVLYKDDVRSKIVGRDNPLVVGMADFQVVNEIKDLASALVHRIAQQREQFDEAPPVPHHLRAILDRGARLWTQLSSLGKHRPAPAVAEAVVTSSA